MKKIAIFLMLLAPLAKINAKSKEAPISFDSTLLKIVDGEGLLNIGEIFFFAKNTLALLHGSSLNRAKKLAKRFSLEFPEPLEKNVEKGKVGLIFFDGKYKTISDLITYESKNPQDPRLEEALENACKQFKKISAGYVSSVEGTKKFIINLVIQWSELRNRPDTFLLKWCKFSAHETEELQTFVTSFKFFGTFLQDLLKFLKDLIQNCPISHEEYRKQQNKKTKNHAQPR